MKALVVVGHPAPGSFNRALAETIRETWTTVGCGATASSARRRWLAEVTALANKAMALAKSP